MKYISILPLYDATPASIDRSRQLFSRVIVLPLLCDDFKRAIQENKRYTDLLIGQYQNGAEIICLCVGALYLASTGLLEK